MRQRTAGELVAEALEAEAVDTVFGLIGSHTYGIYEALRHFSGIRHVTVYHESTATLAADAWSKLSGKTAVCILTAGPGALNSISGVGQSHFSATPMVHISGAPPSNAMAEELHGADNEYYCAQMFAEVSKLSLRPRTLEELGQALSLAFRTARSGRYGPVHLEVPLDLMDAAPAPAPEYSPLAAEVVNCPVNVTEKIARDIAAAQRPLFCFDKGVVRTGVSHRLVSLAERCGAAMVVSRDAIGAVPDDHPLYAGVAHDFNFGDAGFDTVASADLVVCFGYRRNTENLFFISSRLNGSLFNFSFEDEPGAFEGGYSASLERVCDGLEKTVVTKPHNDTQRWPEVRLSDQRKRIVASLDAHSQQTPLHFGWALKQLLPSMDEDTTVVLDAGTHEVWGRTIMPVYNPGSQIGSANWATMGYALPAMIGARLAAKEKPVIGITGDGCLLMAMSDLATWLDAGGPSTLVVLNDSEYGMIAQSQEARFGGTYAIETRPVNFAELANSLGGKGYRVETAKQLELAIEAAFPATRPTLIDITSQPRMDYPVWT